LVEGATEYTFSRIADVEVTEDGRLLVSDAASQDIRVFDIGGRYRRRIGRHGEGPGEFVIAPSIVGISGDTLCVEAAASP